MALNIIDFVNLDDQIKYQPIYWSPNRISTTLWLDADDSDTIIDVAGVVSQWNDKSGNANHAIQSVAADQPSTSGDFNGLNTIQFNEDYFNLTTPLTNVRAMMFVSNVLANPLVTPIIGTTIASGDYTFIRGNDLTYSISIDGGVGATGSASVLGRSLTSGTNIDLGLSLIEKNGKIFWYVEWDADVEVTTIARLIGNVPYQLIGDIGEIVLLSYVPTLDIRQKLEGYLAWRWALQNTLPASHPYKTDGTIFGYRPSWTPTEITTAAWFDASDTDTITESGGSVSQWNDKSGNGNNAIQGTAIDQPMTGTLTISNLNTITGDSANSGEAWMSVIGAETVQSCFAVFDVSTDPASLSKIMSLGADNALTPDSEIFVRYAAQQVSFDGTGTNTGKYNLNGGVDSGYDIGFTDKDIRSGCNLIGTTSISTFTLNACIGRNTAGVGPTGEYQLGEVIWFASEPALADKQKVEGYLAWKWGIQEKLPSNHPYKNTAPTVY